MGNVRTFILIEAARDKQGGVDMGSMRIFGVNRKQKYPRLLPLPQNIPVPLPPPPLSPILSPHTPSPQVFIQGNYAVVMEYVETVWEIMEEEVEELEYFEEVEVIKEVEAYPQYMHPSHGLKRPPPLTHQTLSMERENGQAFRPLAVKPPL